MTLTGAGRRARSVLVFGALLGGTILVGAGLAACSSPGPSHHAGATTTTTTSTPGSTTRPTAATTTTVPGCTGANDTLSLVGSQGAAGTNELTFALKNTASATCPLFGYPGILLLGPSGALHTTTVRGGTESFTNLTPTQVKLAPGASAYFNLAYSDVTTGTESSCPTATGIQVIPPNTTTELKVSGSFMVCNNGTVTVSPVFGSGSADTQTTAPAIP